MKVLRLVLLLAGLALMIWGVVDFFSNNSGENNQAAAKIILGIFGILACFLAKNRR